MAAIGGKGDKEGESDACFGTGTMGRVLVVLILQWGPGGRAILRRKGTKFHVLCNSVTEAHIPYHSLH